MTQKTLKGFLNTLATGEYMRKHLYPFDELAADFRKQAHIRKDLLRRVNAKGIETLEALEKALVNDELAYMDKDLFV